jgi:single-stranded DNA-binding protein
MNNFVSAYAQTLEEPREVYTSATSTAIRCMVGIPAVGNKSATQIELNVYGKNAERFARAPKGAHVYIHGAKLRHDLDTRTHSLHGGTIAAVNDQFPIFNDVILVGRCVKDLEGDARAFKTTESGLMICQQTLSVSTGKNQADLFNFYAINSANDKLNNAELLFNFTRKGTGLTLRGRLVTDSWTDQSTKERKSQTKIQLVSMTLSPKGSGQETKPIQPQATVRDGTEVQPLWNSDNTNTAVDPWSVASGGGLPDLPGHYGPAPELDDQPF